MVWKQIYFMYSRQRGQELCRALKVGLVVIHSGDNRHSYDQVGTTLGRAMPGGLLDILEDCFYGILSPKHSARIVWACFTANAPGHTDIPFYLHYALHYHIRVPCT